MREKCSIDPVFTNPLEGESTELIAVLAAVLGRTRGRG
jgi:hypothetical protein